MPSSELTTAQSDAPVSAGLTPTAPPSIAERLRQPRTILSFVLALAVIGFAFSRLDISVNAVATEIAHANVPLLILAFATYYGSFALRAVRWRSLLNSAEIRPAPGSALPGIPGIITIFVLSWLANCLVPAKLGDAYRSWLLKQRAGTGFSAGLGTIIAERFADLVGLGLVLGGSALLVFGRHLPAGAQVWVIVAVALGAALILGLFLVRRYRGLLRRIVPARVRSYYILLEESALGSFGRLPTLAGLTLVLWLLEGVRLYLVGLSTGTNLSAAAALFVALLASLLTAVPVTPAGLGFVEFGVVGALTLIGVTDQTAASVALLDRLIAYWSLIPIGGLLWLVYRWRWRARH